MHLQKGPQSGGFEGVAISNLPDALKPATSKTFPVLFADAFQLGAEDTLTVVRGLPHAGPIATTVVLGNSPSQADTLPAKLAHTDEMISQSIGSRNQRIRDNLDTPRTNTRMKPEPAASILAHELDLAIHNGFDLMEEAAELACIAISPDEWPGRLPQLLAGLILRWKLAPAATRSVSITARNHGEVCREHAYNAAIMDEESRKLQVNALSTRRKEFMEGRSREPAPFRHGARR
jgi:hypothetical protein